VPPLPRFQIDGIEDLARQLRFAPGAALLRDLERTESFAFELDAAIQYPLAFVVYRVTGYRPERSGDALIAGAVLLGELATLAEHLSAACGLELDSVPGALSAEDLCRRWNVSRKTLERYRRRGLLSRRVLGAGGKPRIAYTPAAIEAFERREPATLAAATRFSRLEPELRRRVIEEARLRADQGATLNQAALAIAEQIGRGHETIRQILQQHDRALSEPLFGSSGPLGPRDRRFCYRAWRRAAEPGEIARRVGKPRSAVLRVVADERAAALRGALTPLSRGLRSGTPDEAAVNPNTPDLPIGLPGPESIEDLLRIARELGPMTAERERALLAASRELRRRAVRAIGQLPEHGNSPAEVDQIETDLRWSARLKAELLRGQLPLLLRAIESRAGGPAERLGARLLRTVLRASLTAAAEAVDGVNPSDRGRLAAPVSLAVDRVTRELIAASVTTAATQSGRARRTIGADASIEDFTRAVYPWQHLVEPDARLRWAAARAGQREAEIIRLRYGYVPSPAGRPVTLAELAQRLGTKPLHAARSERAAVRNALAAARQATTMPA
jgi:hypothetical protein